MIYLRMWRRASSILLRDLPWLALAGRSYQQTRQLYVLYMLWDKIRRRGFSDKTVKDYLSFGGPVVICYQNGFCGEKKEWRGWKDDGKGCIRGREGVGVGGRWGLEMAEGGGELSCREDFVFSLISCPLPSLPGTPSIQWAECQSHFELAKQTQ